MSASERLSILYAQNFLKDPRLIAQLLDRTGFERDDVVYEIGPGKGVITRQLALRYKQIIAIEKDPALSARLQQEFACWPNVAIRQGDFLCYPLPRQPYKVFANIPFNITAAIVGRLTTTHYAPEDMYLCMQREAAEMFLGEPRTSLRALLLKPWFEAAIVYRFARQDFTPAPRVDVVMLRLRKRGPPLVQPGDTQYFRDFLVYSFTGWQPTTGSRLNTLFTRPQRKYIQRALGVDLSEMPTSLSIEQWLGLFDYFKTVTPEQARRLIEGSEKRLAHQQQGLQKIHRTRSFKDPPGTRS